MDKNGPKFLIAPLKSRLSRLPLLQCEDFSLQIDLSTDASEVGARAVLTQTDETGRRPVASCSRELSDAEQGSYTHERELLQIVYALKNLHPCLHGSNFRMLTNRHLFKYIISQKKTHKSGQRGQVYARVQLQPEVHKGKTKFL